MSKPMVVRWIGILSRVCLVLGALASALWCRSWFVSDQYQRVRTQTLDSALQRTTGTVASHRGNLWIVSRTVREATSTRLHDSTTVVQTALGHDGLIDLPRGARWGAIHTRGFATASYRSRLIWVCLPWAAILVLLCLAPSIHLITLLARRRHPQSEEACRACGYDLRATPDRCPECGTLPHVTAGV